MVSQVTSDLKDLSNNIDNVDLLINGLNETSTVLATRTPALTLLLSPAGVAGLRRDTILGNIFGTLLPSLGSIYNGGYWLTPLINSLGNALKAVQGSKQAVEAEYPAYRQFITDQLSRKTSTLPSTSLQLLGLTVASCQEMSSRYCECLERFREL